MKQKFFIAIIGALLLIAASLFFQSFGGSEKNAVSLGQSVYKIYPLDSLSNAATESVAVPHIFAERYEYNYEIKTASLTGTKSVKLYVDESNALTPSAWYTVDSVSAVGANVRAKGQIYGRKQRLRVAGTGTQLTSYQVTATWKRMPD